MRRNHHHIYAGQKGGEFSRRFSDWIEFRHTACPERRTTQRTADTANAASDQADLVAGSSGRIAQVVQDDRVIAVLPIVKIDVVTGQVDRSGVGGRSQAQRKQRCSAQTLEIQLHEYPLWVVE